MLCLLAVWLVAEAAGHGDRQTAFQTELPAPTGRHSVGRVTVHWTDRSRTEPGLAEGTFRELMVDAWYPAERVAGPAAHYIDPRAFEDARSAEWLKALLRGAYGSIAAGRVRTHAVERAPFARSIQRTPVLLFSHGGGEAREAYSAQLADLASHGYVVAAITHTYESVLALLPDGRRVGLMENRWPRPTVSSVEGLPPREEANPDRLRWLADDIRFVLNELTRNNVAPTSLPLAGHLDLQRVGAFGHSAGGQAAATACQLDQRLRACLNQDGSTAFAPYYMDSRGWGMDQAFMFMVKAPRGDRIPDEALAEMKMTREQAEAVLAAVKARQETTLERSGRGSYRVLLHRDRTRHDDFTDLALLQSTEPAEAARCLRILDVVRTYTRAFFEEQLKRTKSPLLTQKPASEFVEAVETFPPGVRPR